MGLYDDISYRLISHCDEIFPFRVLGTKMDPLKTMEILSKIPLEGERLMSSEEVLSFYD